MTERQQRFVQEYLIDLNATQAAIRAGYSPKNADVAGPRLLGNVGIASEIAKAQSKVAARAEVSAAAVLGELMILLTSDVRYFTVDEVTGQLQLAPGAPDSAWRAVSSVKHRIRTIGTNGSTETVREVEFRLWPKDAAARMLGEHLKLYTQKVEHQIPAGTGVLAIPLPVTPAEWAESTRRHQEALTNRRPVASSVM